MQIQAAVSREGAAFPVLETLEIEAPRPGEVLVRMVASGICHTDIGVHGRPGPRPIVLGHEGAGIVEGIGEGVTSLAPGDHVVMSGNACGRCPSCRRNAPSYCAEMLPRNFGGLRPDGTSPLSQGGEHVFARFFGQSSFATYALADATSAVKVPASVPLEVLGPLGCGVVTGAGAVINSLALRAGQSIAVFGTGSVGLSAIMAARLVGASRIIAVDPLPARLALARELGATDTIDPATADAGKAIRELTRIGVDASFNTTSVSAVFTQALDCLAQQGTAGFVATPPPGWAPEMFDMLAGGRSLKGILGGDAVPGLLIPILIEFYRQGRFPFDRLITFYPFEKIADAFHDSTVGTTIKPVLRMPA